MFDSDSGCFFFLLGRAFLGLLALFCAVFLVRLFWEWSGGLLS